MLKKATKTKEPNKKIASKEAYAYTPGLKVKRITKVRKERVLPIRGQVLVKVGDHVDFETIVAKAEMPGDPEFIPASDILNCRPEELMAYMEKKVGDSVEKGEVVAKFSGFFGLFKKLVVSPVDGVVENVSKATGRILLRANPILIEVKAYMPGEITEVFPEEGVAIENNAAFIQGILGVGGESHGEICITVDSPTDRLTPDRITPEMKGKIVVGGSLVTGEALKKAIEVGVKAVIVGGIEDVDLIELLGYELGVAITGDEEIGLTLIITEGYGQMNMAHHTFELFKTFEGEEAAVNGKTQIRAGVLRPEIIIPHNRFKMTADLDELSGGMKPGTPIRVIRKPYFGALGKVVSLPVELQEVESESKVRVMEIELDSGETVIVPRANVEIIEE